VTSDKALKDLSALPHGARVCLYGAGRGANLFTAHLNAERTDITVTCLMDTFKRGVKNGLPIIGPGDYANLKVGAKNNLDTDADMAFDLIIVVSLYWREITATLRDMGIDNYLVADLEIIANPNVEFSVRQRELKNSVYRELLQELWQRGDDGVWLADELLRLENDGKLLDRYAALKHLLGAAPNPNHINALLCQWEIDRGMDTLSSFPLEMGLALTNRCNIRCRFCKYREGLLPQDFLTLGDIKRIEWFKYLSGFALNSSTAEPLVNPEFIPIFNYIREGFPHLNLSMFTNAVGLSEAVVHALAGRLDYLHISMNASNEADYNRVIERGSWRRFSSNMKTMARILKRHRRPLINASFVMIRSNIERAVEFVEYAAAHGAYRVALNHYIYGFNESCYGYDASEKPNPEKLDKTESLYYDKPRSDEFFSRALERGRQLGIEVDIPLPFSSPEKWINFTNRSAVSPPEKCLAPWTFMALRWGDLSLRPEVWICCGSALDTGIYYDRKEAFSADGLLRIRNCPELRAFRRTVNPPTVNPVCANCRSVDRFEPGTDYPPDQRGFYEYNGLPLPEHLRRNR
jgi:MoaA/NifB/PqqE/SkfB family radical SAM enzyme